MIQNEEIIKAIINELYARRNVVFAIFCVISLSFLAVGATWPKKYSAFTIIQVDETNILQSLMRGTAESTQTVDHAANAREIIFGEKIMQEVVKDDVWQKKEDKKQSEENIELQQEWIKQSIRSNTSITSIGENLLKIVYTDVEPNRAFVTTKTITDLFIFEGERSKSKESKAAYDFIDKQVNEYLAKLTKVEEDLREFRSNNPDSRPGLETETSRRITSLENEVEQTRLELNETRIRRDSIKKQLAGEAAITISQTRENQFRTKIAELQNQLDTLRLDYKESYPDIVRIKHQIAALKKSLTEEAERRNNISEQELSRGALVDESVRINPLYNRLRSDAANTEIKISTLESRIADLTKTLELEYQRARKIHEGEVTLSTLTRDYQVNQEIYQDLLRRREKARVSKSIDQEQQGLNYELQEPAKLPLIPTGLRFMHFVLAGLLLGLAVPIGLIFLMLQIDPRIRFTQVITAELNIPVLTEISRITTMQEEHGERVNVAWITGGVCFIFVVIAYVSWLKHTGVIS